MNKNLLLCIDFNVTATYSLETCPAANKILEGVAENRLWTSGFPPPIAVLSTLHCVRTHHEARAQFSVTRSCLLGTVPLHVAFKIWPING